MVDGLDGADSTAACLAHYSRYVPRVNFPNNVPAVADHGSLIDSLQGHPRYAELRGCADGARRAQSCAADLSSAQACCDALGQVDGLDPLCITPVSMFTIRHSLVSNAVVLYARATSTHSDGGERGCISIDNRLSESELIDHRILIDVRNRVIAHVHTDESVGDSVWHQERLIVKADGLPGCATRRIQVDAATITRLRRMVPIANRLVRQTFHKRINRLTEAINEIHIPEALLRPHPFDAVKFFGDEAAAKEALSPGPGKSSFGLAK